MVLILSLLLDSVRNKGRRWNINEQRVDISVEMFAFRSKYKAKSLGFNILKELAST